VQLRAARVVRLPREVAGPGPARVPGLWSVVCFYLPPAWRRRGLGRALLEAATERAFALGATEVEGFPVVPHKPGGHPGGLRVDGPAGAVRGAGFHRLRRVAEARPIYVRQAPRRTTAK